MPKNSIAYIKKAYALNRSGFLFCMEQKHYARKLIRHTKKVYERTGLTYQSVMRYQVSGNR